MNNNKIDDLGDLPFLEHQENDSFAVGKGAVHAGSPQARSLEAGDLLGERYEIRECIGVGGMGVVYRAFDRTRSEEIAVKTMHAKLVDRSSAREAFQREASLATELHHRAIVRTHGAERVGRTSLLTMELLRGRSLREELDSLSAMGSTMPFDRVLEIAHEVCGALEYAHTRMVHRDVKPGNIFLCEDGGVKLLDFGISRLIQGEDGTTTSTGTGLGTAYYVAPELVKGARDIDHRADQFGLAATVYEMLTGQVPLGAVRPVSQIRGDVGKATSDAIMRAIADQPSRRHGSIGEFSRALEGRRIGRFVVIGGAIAAASMAVLIARPLGQDSQGSASIQPAAHGLEAPVDASPLLLNQAESALNSVLRHEGAVSDAATHAKNADSAVHAALWVRLEVAMKSRILAGGGAEEASATSAFYREFRTGEPIPADNAEQLRAALSWASSVRAELELAPKLSQLYLEVANGAAGELASLDEAIDDGLWSEAVSDGERIIADLKRRRTIEANRSKLLDEAAGLEPHFTPATQAALRAIGDSVLERSTGEALNQIEAELVQARIGLAEALQQSKAPMERLAKSFDIDRRTTFVQGDELPLAITHRATGIQLQLVVAGVLAMGDPNGPREERPEVQVEVNAFYLAVQEVSVGQWEKGGGASAPGSALPTHPMVGIRFDEAFEWCANNGMRLPAEAEWEWAASGPEGRRWPWGHQWSEGKANSSGRSDGSAALGASSAFSDDIGPFGHVSMAGNAAEWCADPYRADHSEIHGGVNASGLASLKSRQVGNVVRGGSFRSYKAGCRATARRPETGATDWIGFRAAVSLPR